MERPVSGPKYIEPSRTACRWTLFYSNGTAGRSVGFDFCTGNASGERFSVGGSLQPVFPFDGGMRTAARGMAVVDAAERIYQTAIELARG